MTKAFIRLFDYFQNHKAAYWASMVARQTDALVKK